MPDESLIEEMRAALRGDRLRAESRQVGHPVADLSESGATLAAVPPPSPGAGVDLAQVVEPDAASPLPQGHPSRGLLERLARLRSRR